MTFRGAVIAGWKLQKEAADIPLVTFLSALCPGLSAPVSHLLSFAVAVCGTMSSFTQRIRSAGTRLRK
jgi:hypothetical protein